MVWLGHVHYITALSVLCAQGCRAFSLSLSVETHTHSHTLASCIWTHQPTVHPKAPWEICKLADAQHCPSCSPVLVSLTRRVSLQTRVWPMGVCLKGVYEYLRFLNQTLAQIPLRPPSNAGSELRREALPALSAGTKVISYWRAHRFTSIWLWAFTFSQRQVYCSQFRYEVITRER